MNDATIANLWLNLWVWLVAVLSSIVAMWFALSKRHYRPRVAIALAALSIVTSGTGCGWMPGFYFPHIGFSHTSDAFEFHLKSDWLFYIPLVLGTITLIAAMGSLRKTHPCRR